MKWIRVASVVGIVLMAPGLASALSRTGDAVVTFAAVATGGIKLEGKTSELEVAEADGKVKIAVPLGQLDTGIALRNRHMREKYLEVQRFPSAELVIERAALKVPAEAATAAAQMTLHGRSKPVSVRYSVRPIHGGYAVTGTTHVDMRDFGIDVPSYLGVTVKPGVDIDVRFSVTD